MGYFLPFYPPNSWNNENFTKWKKGLDISLFNTIVPQIIIICYTVPDIWCVTDVFFFFILGNFLPFYPPNRPKKQNFKKKKKKNFLEISSFYTSVPKFTIRWCTVPQIWCVTDGWTDRRMDGKSGILRWVHHLKINII